MSSDSALSADTCAVMLLLLLLLSWLLLSFLSAHDPINPIRVVKNYVVTMVNACSHIGVKLSWTQNGAICRYLILLYFNFYGDRPSNCQHVSL